MFACKAYTVGARAFRGLVPTSLVAKRLLHGTNAAKNPQNQKAQPASPATAQLLTIEAVQTEIRKGNDRALTRNIGALFGAFVGVLAVAGGVGAAAYAAAETSATKTELTRLRDVDIKNLKDVEIKTIKDDAKKVVDDGEKVIKAQTDSLKAQADSLTAQAWWATYIPMGTSLLALAIASGVIEVGKK